MPHGLFPIEFDRAEPFRAPTGRHRRGHPGV